MNKIDTIKIELEKIIDPSLKKPLKETEGIKHIGYDEENDIVTLIVAVGEKTPELEKELKLEITKLIKLDLGHAGIKLQIDCNSKHYFYADSFYKELFWVQGNRRLWI